MVAGLVNWNWIDKILYLSVSISVQRVNKQIKKLNQWLDCTLLHVKVG